MPELPEVETVCRSLHQSVAGSTIKSVVLRRIGLRVPFSPELAERLANRAIQAVERRAKYLLFRLDSRDTLVVHLGMTGRFSVLTKAPKAYNKHDHAIFLLKDGRCLVFNDARRFGLVLLASAAELETLPQLAELGPEPLSDSFSPAYLKQALSARKGPIKPVLMDQALVVGVGNIYASEALFLAGVNPKKPAYKAVQHADMLVSCVRQVLEAAIASGGSSLRDFLQPSGEEGYFQHQFQVYGRKGEPCFHCHTPIGHVRQAGRSTFYCPRCQK